MTASPLAVTRDQLRAIRILQQELHRPGRGPAAAALTRTGFVRTLGGVDGYLGVRARVPTLRREQLDAAIAAADVQVRPAVRGCMYLVARADAPLCLRIAEQLSASRDRRDRDKAGIRDGETEALADLALAQLQRSGPLTTDALRRALPDGAVRSLGERGKKVGVSSPLPGALRQLEFRGAIERTPETNRIDTERYLWRAAARSPFADATLPDDPTRLHALLLDRHLAFAGVATLAEFCAWSGLTQRDAKLARAHSTAIDVRIDGALDALATPDVQGSMRELDAATAAIALLPFADNLLHLGGGPALMVDEAFHDLQVPVWGGKGEAKLGVAEHVSFRPVLAHGSVRGFWEFDPDQHAIHVQWLAAPDRATRARVDELAAATATFLRDELGHGRSFSLDTDDDLRARLRMLRAMATTRATVVDKPTARANGQPGARAAATAARKPAKKAGADRTGATRARKR